MSEDIRVWDIFVRVFHWSLVVTVLIALLTEDDFLSLHVYAGYGAGLLIMVRIVWGVVGPRHARFSDFIYSPATVIGYLRDLRKKSAIRYLGHSPAGGAMVIVLMVVVLLNVVTGLATYGAEEHAGPLAAYFADSGHFTRNLLEEVHETLASALWLVIALHVAGVIYSSFVHRENLVPAMFTGMKRKL